MPPSPVMPTIDLSAPGIGHGYLRLPHSSNESAWGVIQIPLTVVANGSGPTALLTGANHGDEYEGPIALHKLASRLRPERIQGRVIIIPAMNYPAFRAGSRCSPIDQGNMNRIFPGRPDGSVTEKIADFFQRYLLPEVDYVLDIHAGGKTLEFLPFAAAHILPDSAQQARCEAAMRAFAAPYQVLLLEMDAMGMYDTAAEMVGKVFVSTELGGGGSASCSTVGIAERGIHNFLIHAGILDDTPKGSDSITLHMPDTRCYSISEQHGLLEMCVGLGGPVTKGQVLARIYDYTHTGVVPTEYSAELDGILAGRHFPGLIHNGDCIAVVAVPT
ncbi:MAG TPA: N-alpha-acetyl diaminobutyric acid deacetylase DoeB [Gammaproteobacteria bacterium]|nr:N-alpha-acetyl diaminobutyric acid deacetylase DoeB [Gammaproteobacteria bacterium]